MKIAIIGCGVIGSALAVHLSKNHAVYLYDRQIKKSRELAAKVKGEAFEDLSKAAEGAEVIVLCIKPQDLPHLAGHLTPHLKKQLLISVLAGMSTTSLKKHFPKSQIIRTMPNLAMTVGDGIIGLVEDETVPEELKNKAKGLFEGLGLAVWIPEAKADALTALAASGPAFILVLIESMIESGVLMGFSAEESKVFVLKALSGTVKLLEETGKHPAELKLQIASPSGMTIMGLKQIELGSFRASLMNAIFAAFERGKQLQF